MLFIRTLFYSLVLFPCWALQHPTGFITLTKYIEEGGDAKLVLQEFDSQQFVLLLENGVVINEGGIVTQDGKVFKDTETYKEDQHRLLRGKRNISHEDFVFFDGRLAVISSPGQENWYHWLFQVLPRIKILADSGIDYDKIYLNNLKYSWQRESLGIIMKLFNISEDRLFLVTGDSMIEASTLIIPSIPFIPSKSPVFPQWLKDFIQKSFLVDQEEENMPERIYISRSKASVRRISNESDFTNLLSQNGFTILNLEELSVYEQAKIFHHAKVIVGPHGSGFSNLIFSKRDTCVVEIDHGLVGDQRSFYKRMAQIMACKYHGYYSDVVEEEDLETDIVIDIPDFTHFCRQLGLF